MTGGYRCQFEVPAGHPCLAGHFPGRPLVPAVLLLEQVALALRAWQGGTLARVPEAKFLAPLGPGQVATLTLDERLRFEIRRDGQLLARGRVEGGR
ncbi:MAG TPA: hydroxymyristoyl-ACP dehydratase [Rhodanobacteraceae bacterium]|nr:hydroxymyristoyl-ACP dehydratase [Rhodanobacteraceae bacterium]